MNFRAFIRRGSEVYRRWRHEARIGGTISDVRFHWDGLDYVSDEDPLSAESVAAIKDNNMVQLVLTTAPVGHVSPIEDAPAAEPLPEQPKPRVTITLPQRPSVKSK